MRDQIKKKFNYEKIKKLNKHQTSLYNQNNLFKLKVHRVLDIIGSKDLNSKIEFCCKTFNANILPPLDQDSMNSQGSAKILNVLDYIFFEDNLCQHIHGAPTNAEKKSGSN